MRMVIGQLNNGNCDYQNEATVDIFDWINEEQDRVCRLFRISTVASAWSAFKNYPHNYNDSKLRLNPRVAYDPISDIPYFIIKQDNNGIVYFVGKYRLPVWLYPYLDNVMVMDEFVNQLEITSLDDYKNTWRIDSNC